MPCGKRPAWGLLCTLLVFAASLRVRGVAADSTLAHDSDKVSDTIDATMSVEPSSDSTTQQQQEEKAIGSTGEQLSDGSSAGDVPASDSADDAELNSGEDPFVEAHHADGSRVEGAQLDSPAEGTTTPPPPHAAEGIATEGAEALGDASTEAETEGEGQAAAVDPSASASGENATSP